MSPREAKLCFDIYLPADTRALYEVIFYYVAIVGARM